MTLEEANDSNFITCVLSSS